MPKRPPLTPVPAKSRGARTPAAALLRPFLLALILAPRALAQGGAPASVSGQVREGERGVPGVMVALMTGEPGQGGYRTVARTKTDDEGRFLLSGVAAGRYQILPYAPALVVQGMTDDYRPGRMLTLLAGEEVKDIDFRVARGGVITGRVTDADGNPVIAEAVAVTPAEPNAQMPRNNLDFRAHMTDDRGVYRIYGLPAGRYRVSVGQGSDEQGTISFGRRKLFRRTFHPDATDASAARLVEVRPGAEIEDVDITLGRALKTYGASGRFIIAETGLPAVGVPVAYGTLDATKKRINSYGGANRTDERGEFQTEGLSPGHYAVFSAPAQEGSEFYSDPLTFEVTDSDVKGLVVRLKRGASVSGVVQIEGLSDRAAAARMLSQVRVYGRTDARSGLLPPGLIPAVTVTAADGAFRLAGLRPGRLQIGHSAEAVKGLSFSRLELNGAPVQGGIEIAEGAQVAGVRLVLIYGTGVITGQTTFVNGAPPPGSRLMAQARRAGAEPDERGRSAEVDARGFFRIEGLPAGEYEVLVHVFAAGQARRSEPQHVSLAEGAEARVAPVVNFAGR